MPRFLLLFLDGVGIGPADPDVNPFFRASLPTLTGALGGALPSLEDPIVSGGGGRAFPVDACLGVPGMPQSGTGQIALLTGRNAPKLFGRHFGPWPPVSLRPLLEQENLLRHGAEEGFRIVFANAYPSGYLARASPRRAAAVPMAAGSAGLLERGHAALAEGRAVASEIVNDTWRAMVPSARIPELTPEGAGHNLARIAASADLTLFAHYHTDLVGHRGGMGEAVATLERLDRFFSGVLAALPPDILTLVVSDHGNVEDIGAGHTRNPALGMALGPGAEAFSPPPSLTHVAEAVLSGLRADAGGAAIAHEGRRPLPTDG